MIMIGGVRGVRDHRGELLLSTKENEHHTFQPRLFCQGDDDDINDENNNDDHDEDYEENNDDYDGSNQKNNPQF